MPPSLRKGGGGKDGGKGNQDDEHTLRVTNLSDDVRGKKSNILKIKFNLKIVLFLISKSKLFTNFFN